MATISIEFLIVLIILGMFFFWWIWFVLSRAYYERRYKEENDKGLQGELKRREHIRELERRNGKEPSASNSISSISGQREPKGQSILSPADIINNGETSNSPRETSTSNGNSSKKFRFRNPFARGNRK